ncbi:fumarate reductase [Burkholderia sp. PAMC 28687]|uniref:FAD-dependent oxidoreductase n=1 Tax=Burkholderia sp. PAMC 28687 TaxID=1795874 RepID=UPI000780B2EB|nr:FAD-dependent oxidoreductase [Burkholderia sp. PAMC 28687]AMM16394.1 fumarate reductase [Burkholderia sp. PAMC 28687]
MDKTIGQQRFDVVVIGSGIAGLSAAVAAANAGAKVAIVERANEEEYGGNTRWTEAYFRMKSESEVSDDFEERLISNAGDNLDPNIVEAMGGEYATWPPYVKAHGMPDPELVFALSSHAGPTVAWLRTFGIRFDTLPTYFVTAAAPRLMPVGGGLAMIEALLVQAKKLGVEVFYRTTARHLARENSHGDMSLQATGPEGQALEFDARSVIVASGGFQGNPEMMTRYLGQAARFVRPVARGGYYNKGEGIQMALAAGAAPAGDFGSYHAEPLDPRSGATEALVMNFSYGILINLLGKRFVDEAPGPVDVHYDHISRAFGEQPKGKVYVVFDKRIDDVPNWKRSIRTDQHVIQAESLEALAEGCELPVDAFMKTVREYNAACPEGRFSPLEVDGLATQGLEIPKSNWSRPIATGPFFAYPIIPGICFTYGGVKTNTSAQVIDADGRPIPGLYAAGEAAGLYYQVYTGATSVMRGAVFGKIAGEHAAARSSSHASANGT